MPNVTIDIDGVITLLQRINPSKATGPDLIPMRVLKGAASAIAPYLCFTFQQSTYLFKESISLHLFKTKLKKKFYMNY